MRIVSLVPSATEILFAIGSGPEVVGRTHECDYPEEARRLPALTSDVLVGAMPSAVIDAAVTAGVRDRHSIYELDVAALRDLSPDLVVTQTLCDVCAVPAAIVQDAVCSMSSVTQVVSADPDTLDAVWSSILDIAAAAGADAAGDALVGSIRRRLRLVDAATAGLRPPRVAVIEWPDPLFAPGHWVPDMVAAAGGSNVFGSAGLPSVQAGFEELYAAQPDVVVLAFCGFDLKETQLRLRELAGHDGWQRLAMRARIVAVDGSSYFSRPGPRIADGVELLGWALHQPDIFLKPRPGRGAELIEAGWIDIASLPVREHEIAH